MGTGLMPPAYYLGRQLALVGADETGVELEGACRLAPGRLVTLFGLPSSSGNGRPARVVAWRLVRANHTGLTYRGRVEWRSPAGDGRHGP